MRRKAGHAVHVGLHRQRDPELATLRQFRDQVDIALDQRVMALDDQHVGRALAQFIPGGTR